MPAGNSNLHMVTFKRFTAPNGLRIIVNEDRYTPLVAMNILYMVGSRDEDPSMTGLAHLFEHLMFSGSVNIPDYDSPLQMAGGENNAYTNNDVTVYYLSIPAENIETGFWLESDRMLGLNFSEENLEIQKRVVSEEFKQRYLNQPYGDSMHILRDAAYTVHPYKWPTIGKSITHIENVSPGHIRDFFFSHYAPNNAILTFSGNITPDNALRLTEKWFGSIPSRNVPERRLPAEPSQTEPRIVTVERNVPADLLYKSWHVCPRDHSDFRVLDLLTDVLAGGDSGRLYAELVREKRIFSDINAYLTGDLDPGLLLLYGRLMNGIDIRHAEEEVMNIIKRMMDEPLPPEEMEKVKNKFEASTVLSNVSILNKATNLSLYEMLGDAEIMNGEVDRYRAVTPGDVMESVNRYLQESGCTTLYYKSSGKRDEE